MFVAAHLNKSSSENNDIQNRLKRIEDSAKITARIFLFMLLGCLYSLITIFGTTDIELISNKPISPIPIWGTTVRVSMVFTLGPILLLALYIYFQIYLQRLWQRISKIPPSSIESKPLHLFIHPWFIISLAYVYFPGLKSKCLIKFQKFISCLLAYYIVPLTLIIYWFWFLVRRQKLVTYLHILLIIISIVTLILSMVFTKRSFPINKKKSITLKILCLSLIIIIPTSLGLISFTSKFYSLAPKDMFPRDSLTLVPWIYDKIKRSPFLQLEEQDISVQPSFWDLKNESISLVKGANLRYRDLRYAQATGAFLARADLRNSKLTEAKMSGIDLRRARMDYCTLIGANLFKAKLWKANLISANLHGAILDSADLFEANLVGATLYKTKLQGANFIGANIERANIQEARMENVKGLAGDMLRSARNWLLAYYSDNLLDTLGLLQNHPNHNTNIENMDLTGYNLKGVNLEKAILSEFKGITKEQYNLAITDKNTIPPRVFAE